MIKKHQIRKRNKCWY